MRALWLLLLSLPAVGATDFWGVGSLTKIRPQTLPPRWAPAVTLELCRGEVGGLQVALRSDRRLARVSLQPLRLRLGGTNIVAGEPAFFRQHYVQVTQPSGNADSTSGWWPDALLPQALLTDRSVPPDWTAGWWIDVAVPSDAAAGVWRGELLAVADAQELRLPVELTVVDVRLPVERSIRANVAVYFDDILLRYANQQWRPADAPWGPHDPDYLAFRQDLYELLLEHRLCAYDLPVAADSPNADRWLRDPRVHSVRLPWLDDHGSAALQALLGRATRLGVRHKLYYYAADEPAATAYLSVREAAAHLHRLAPGVPFVATIAPVEELVGSVDTWCPNLGNFLGLGYLDPDGLTRRRDLGEEVWWYTCCVPLAPYPTWLVDDTALAPRVSLWAMARYGWSGFVYSMAHGWSPDPYRSVASFNNTNGDGLLLYPGQPWGRRAPLPSLRLKLLREGLQDLELLGLLRRELASAARRRGRAEDGSAAVRELAGRLVAEPWRVSDRPADLLATRHEAVQRLLAARQHDLVLWTDRTAAGTTLRGRLRPRTPLLVDRLALDTSRGEFACSLAPGARAVTLRVGEPGLSWTCQVGQPWPVLEASPPELLVMRTAAMLVDGRGDEAGWSTAEVLTLANGSTVRVTWDDAALYLLADAAQVTVVLDPGRQHRQVLTFGGAEQPTRAVRRTATGREESFSSAWELRRDEMIELRLPFSTLGLTPTVGDVWGATVIATNARGRSFWFDHHADARYLPRLVFR
ncbi:MAG: DUF4091 domain-containing protein [Fimbriimonadaceae bacterium]|nr:DUF4091 domain-containing protein [Fimbriimonadaceae bacterium]